MYFCYYQIKNKEDQSKVFATSYVCFSHFLQTNNDYFKLGREMEIYVPFSKLKQNKNPLTKDDFENLCKEMTKAGMPIKFEVIDKVSVPGAFTLNEQCYKFTLDFDKYETKNLVNLTLTFLRFSYESDMYNIIQFVQDLRKKHSKYSFMLCLSFAIMVIRPDSGHMIWFSNGQPIKAKVWKDYVKKLKAMTEYTNTDVSTFTKNFTRKVPFKTVLVKSEESFLALIKECNQLEKKSEIKEKV